MSASRITTVPDAEITAIVDRNSALGDPDFVANPVALIDETQPGAVGVQRPGDSGRNRPAICNARHEGGFAV